MALKFKEQIHQAGVGGAAAENPPAAPQDSPGEGLDQARRLFEGDGLHLQRPGNAWSSLRAPFCPVDPHARFIGGGLGGMMVVPESNESWPCLTQETPTRHGMMRHW